MWLIQWNSSLKKTYMSTDLYVLMETLRHVGILYQPLIPDLLLDQLTTPSDKRTFAHLQSSPLVFDVQVNSFVTVGMSKEALESSLWA